MTANMDENIKVGKEDFGIAVSGEQLKSLLVFVSPVMIVLLC
jgi:hypothetical protein